MLFYCEIEGQDKTAMSPMFKYAKLLKKKDMFQGILTPLCRPFFLDLY